MTEGSRQWGRRGVGALHGRWLFFLRLMWMALAVLALGLYVFGLPAYYDQLLALSTPDVGNAVTLKANLKEAGLSVGFYAAYGVATEVVFAAVSFTVGFLIFWRRSDEPIALLVALTMVMFVGGSAPLETLAAAHPVLDLTNTVLTFLNTACLILVLYLFPDGRFVPRWSRWFALALIALTVPNFFFPDSPLNWGRWPGWMGFPVFATILGSGVLAQVYRYRKVSVPSQRRQTKWVVFGFVAGIMGFLGLILLSATLLPALDASGLLVDLIGKLGINLVLLVIPISFGVAVLRYRLFDIDVIINRTLVYGSSLAGRDRPRRPRPRPCGGGTGNGTTRARLLMVAPRGITEGGAGGLERPLFTRVHGRWILRTSP